jgi:hypothetical protein
MAEGHGWGGASRAGSNHPALASASAAPPYPRRGALSRTYVAMYSKLFQLHHPGILRRRLYQTHVACGDEDHQMLWWI